MSKHKQFPTLTLLALLLLAACTTAPYTERGQFILLPRPYEKSLGDQAADEILEKEKLSTNATLVNRVRKVGAKIARAASDPEFDWEFHVIDNPKTINAFALPGGKVFIYTGLFKLTETDAELATVIAHEAGHVIARHGAERMSLSIVADLGQQLALQAAGAGGAGDTTLQAFKVAFGIGANVGVILPFSRVQEYEADGIGLRLMAKAGYDPERALDFWTKMAKHSKEKKKPPEYLSTHPSDERRIEAIKELLPEARDYYRPEPS